MSRVKTNFFANLAGSGWTALVGLACTPLYIRFMGMEAYGLIGFYFMLQGVIQILDLGLSPTMNREMARYSVLPGKAGRRATSSGRWRSATGRSGSSSDAPSGTVLRTSRPIGSRPG